jgi:hypothetical protein
MEMQLRIRRNAQEAQDYLDDLLKWQREQKEKDNQLRKADADQTKSTIAKAREKKASNAG